MLCKCYVIEENSEYSTCWHRKQTNLSYFIDFSSLLKFFEIYKKGEYSKLVFQGLLYVSVLFLQSCAVVSQHSSALLNTSGKVAQVVVAMDPARRAVQSAYVVDGSSLSAAAVQSSSEPTSTTSQTMMSPRPSILRKRPHDV